MKTSNTTARQGGLTIPLMIAALAVTVAVTWYASQSQAAFAAATDERARAREGRLKLERALSLFKDVETGARGYAISGQESYLAPYVAAKAALPPVLESLRHQVGTNLPPGMRWEDIDELTRRRLDLAARAIEERRLHGEKVVRETALFDEGKAVMDGIRARFADIDALQDRRIADSNRALLDHRRRANASFVAAGMLTLAFLSLAIYLLSRERTHRLRVESRLNEANARLETRVQERTADLAAAKERIASFALEQDRSIEAERRRLSREVHDQIGQVFTAVKLITGSLPREAFPPGQEAALAQALEMGVAATRRITAELRPPLLDDLGFAAALNHYAGQIVAPAGMRSDVDVADEDALDATQALALFRIVQEAVTNVLRHAKAGYVEISGRRDGAAYVLSVADDGHGIASGTARPGALGLTGMQERAQLLGGECKLKARTDGGTLVEIRLPLREQDQ